jgi:DNA (cytosine-5)-methyltransferase 1
MNFKVASFFSGAGGLDTGFHKAGFDIVWANEYDRKIVPTLKANFPKTKIDDRSITEIKLTEIPDDLDGIIGGPPCQSWSEAGARKGLADKRGQVFLDYIEIIKAKRPKFFLAENVSGMLSITHRESFDFLVRELTGIGYHFSYKLLNASDFGVPQDRLRVFFVGYREDVFKGEFLFPAPIQKKITLRETIFELNQSAKPALEGNKTNGAELEIANHEYFTGGFSSIYMSRNRVRSWDEQSFTIQAGARHAPIHPSAPKMIKLDQDRFVFAPLMENIYRRISVREAARIQTFPDSYRFLYEDVADGYKMVGNAVPVNLAHQIAKQIYKDLKQARTK